MTARHRPRFNFLAVLGATWLLAAACGGKVGDGSSTGTGGQGGKSTGTGGQGGGSTGGSAGTAGQGGGSGGSSCENTPCPDIGCGPGYVNVQEPGVCCPVCKPVPCNAPCDAPACGPDSHLETPPGQCCPIC